MINVNDLVYCRNSRLQVLTINSHTHTTLSLFGFFFLLYCLFFPPWVFFTYKEGLEGIYFAKNNFCFSLKPVTLFLMFWYIFFLSRVSCIFVAVPLAAAGS